MAPERPDGSRRVPPALTDADIEEMVKLHCPVAAPVDLSPKGLREEGRERDRIRSLISDSDGFVLGPDSRPSGTTPQELDS